MKSMPGYLKYVCLHRRTHVSTPLSRTRIVKFTDMEYQLQQSTLHKYITTALHYINLQSKVSWTVTQCSLVTTFWGAYLQLEINTSCSSKILVPEGWSHGAPLLRKWLSALRRIIVPSSSGSRSTVKMKTLWTLRTYGPTTHHHISEYSNLQQHNCEDLASIHKITWCPSHKDSTMKTHHQSIRKS